MLLLLSIENLWMFFRKIEYLRSRLRSMIFCDELQIFEKHANKLPKRAGRERLQSNDFAWSVYRAQLYPLINES